MDEIEIETSSMALLDRLDIKGTHYEALEQARSAEGSKGVTSTDEDLWMLAGDPNDGE